MTLRSATLATDLIRPAAVNRVRSSDWVTSVCRSLLHRQLSRLRHGRLRLHEDGTTATYGQPGDTDLDTELIVDDPAFYADTVLGGSIGAAEAFMRGFWRSPNLTDLVRLFIRNREVLDGMEGGFARLASPVRKAIHAMHRNTVAGSRRNIATHYDLSNDFFALFLDPTMMYSAAVYPRADTSLEEAAIEKVDRICRKLALTPADHVLEIGTGWGGFAIHAATRYGCRVTTTTISAEQHKLAVERVADAGLADRVSVLLNDYRQLKGQYDKLVSIEMIEAVGWQYVGEYFRTCSRLLKPDGSMLLQAITIDDRLYDGARRSVDFIQRYVFPGSSIPSIHSMTTAIRQESDLRLFHLEDIGPHYARTLHDWRQRFFDRLDEVRALGFSDAFIRLWDYYFSYCEGGFAERCLGDVQMLLTKPRCQLPPVLSV